MDFKFTGARDKENAKDGKDASCIGLVMVDQKGDCIGQKLFLWRHCLCSFFSQNISYGGCFIKSSRMAHRTKGMMSSRC